MRTLRLFCWLALPVGALLVGLHAAGAQGSPEARQACTQDAMEHCSEFIPDVPKVTACMIAKRSQLSDGCRTAMANEHRALHRGGHRRHHHCYHCG